MSVNAIPRAFTVAEAVEALHGAVSAKTLRREIAKGNLKARRIARCVRILDDELARWLEDYEAAS